MSTTVSNAKAIEPAESADQMPSAVNTSQTSSAGGSPSPIPPLVTLERTPAWKAINLRDLWHYRELLYFLIWRDIKVRYKQTALGVMWVVLQPLISTLIFTLFLGKLVRVPSDGQPYPLMVFAGLLPWTFFSAAVSCSGNSLVGSAYLITKVYFPRMIIPAAAVGARLLDFAIGFIILVGLLIYYGVNLTPNLLMLPVLTLLVTVFAVAVGMWASAINVKYRDVSVVLPVLIQFWMFLSPVVYPSSLIYNSGLSRGWKLLYMMNPLVGIVDNFRASLFGGPFNWIALAFASVITLALLIYAAYDFRRMERNFADIV